MTTSQLIKPEPTIYFQSPTAAVERLRLFARLQFLEREKERKLAAAKRALSICNKLKPSPTRARHASRIFSALNKLRSA